MRITGNSEDACKGNIPNTSQEVYLYINQFGG
jgi:hypothetical protein